MGAELIVRDKQFVDGTVTEVVVWRLISPVPGCNHPFKYRFYFGLADGTCIVRYDNERGKGDIDTLAARKNHTALSAFNSCSEISTKIRQRGSWPGGTYEKGFQSWSR